VYCFIVLNVQGFFCYKKKVIKPLILYYDNTFFATKFHYRENTVYRDKKSQHENLILAYPYCIKKQLKIDIMKQKIKPWTPDIHL